nr:hypothetical protein [uncultured Campylobacter sp.]
MRNKAALKFKNFTACPRSFWVRTKLARAGAALCCSHPAEAICLEISSAVATPSGVGKNLKSQNFKNRNATSTNCEAGRYIDFSADYDTDRDIRFIAYCCSTCQSINFNADRNLNLNICYDIDSSADYDINLVKGHGMNPSMDYYDIRLGAYRDINSDKHCTANFKISNANLKANLAVLKADLRTDFRL